MSGIFGLWNLDSRPVDRTILADMSRSLAHRGLDGNGYWVDGAVGVGCRLSRVTPESLDEQQPYVSASGIVAVFDGRLDSRQELIAALAHRIERTTTLPDVALVAAAYDVFGATFTTYMNGDFALAVFDPAMQRLTLVRDSLGVRPLYYCRYRSGFLFASEVKALLQHPGVKARPDEEDFAIFLVGNRAVKPGATFFRDICGVVPGCRVTVTPADIKVDQYWDFDTVAQLNLRSYEEYVEAFRHHFQIAVRRRLRSAHPVAVSLSGGLDSSSIFCTAASMARDTPKAFPHLAAYSYVSEVGSPSDEIRYVGAIERMFDVAVHRIPMGSPGFLDGVEQQMWHGESPLLDTQWSCTRTFLDEIRESGARVLLTGHWGDQMLVHYAYFIDLFRTLKWPLFFQYLKEYKNWHTDVSPKHIVRELLKILARELIPEKIRRPVGWLRRRRFPRRQDKWYSEDILKLSSASRKHERPETKFVSSHARSLYEEARSSYSVLCMEWNNKIGSAHGLEMIFPFLDRDLIAFLMAVPPQFVGSDGVCKGLLRSAMYGTLPEQISIRRDKADFTARVNRAQQNDITKLRDLLRADKYSVSNGWVSCNISAEIEDVIKAIGERPDALDARAITDLVGLELWLRIFEGGKRHAAA